MTLVPGARLGPCPEAGSRLGPYEVLAPLGAGWIGEVYRVRDKAVLATTGVLGLSNRPGSIYEACPSL